MNYPTKYVGYVPLVLYLAGCVYSGCVSPMVNLLGKKVVYIITGLLVVGSAIWLEFIKTQKTFCSQTYTQEEHKTGGLKKLQPDVDNSN